MRSVRWTLPGNRPDKVEHRRKKRSEVTQLRRENEALRSALVEALELCWEGRIPFLPIERVLRIRGAS